MDSSPLSINANDEEVQLLLSNDVLSEDEEMPEVRSDTPLSFKQFEEDSYYQQLAEEHFEEDSYYKKLVEEHQEKYQVITFPSDSFNDSFLDWSDHYDFKNSNPETYTINRWVNSCTIKLMFNMMVQKFNNVIMVPEVNLLSSIYYDQQNIRSYHEWCEPEGLVLCEAYIKIEHCTRDWMQDIMIQEPNLFFCGHCNRLITDLTVVHDDENMKKFMKEKDISFLLYSIVPEHDDNMGVSIVF